MEVDIGMKDKQAMALAKKQVFSQEEADGNYSCDSEALRKLGIQNRKGSVDGRDKSSSDFGPHPDYLMGKKRKSQDERANELMKARSQFMKQLPSNLLSEDKRIRSTAFIEGFTKNENGLRD